MKRSIILIIFFTLLLVWWELMAGRHPNVKLLLSSPSESLKYFFERYPLLLKAFLVTGAESLLGIFIAVLICVSLICLCLYYKKLFDLILPVMIVSQVIPIVTLAPLFIILFGIGIKSKVAMATLMCFFPLFVNMASGMNSIDKNYHYLFSLYNASKRMQIVKLYFPLSIPYFFAGLKVSATLAVVGAIVAEFNGADFGLGKNLFLSAKRLEAELLINSIFLSCILGGCFYMIVLFAERRLGKWYINNGNNKLTI